MAQATQQAKQLQSGYEVIVTGQYYAAQDRSKVIRAFGPETFFLPETMTLKTGYVYQEKKIAEGHTIKRAVPKMEKVNSLKWAMHIVQRYLLPARLAEKHKDFVRFRTCTITNTKHVTKEVDPSTDLREENIQNMTLEQLRTLCTIKAVPIPIDDFADIAEARKAVQDELQNLKLAEKKSRTAPVETAEEAETAEDELPLESSADDREQVDFQEGSIATSKVDDDDLFA